MASKDRLGVGSEAESDFGKWQAAAFSPALRRENAQKAVVTKNAAREQLGLEKYMQELEEQGYTVVPPEVTGVTEAQLDRMTANLLQRAEKACGCPFSVEKGPEKELVTAAAGSLGPQTQDLPAFQILLTDLVAHDRAFRDLAVNPVQMALVQQILGVEEARFSSFNSFVKWPGEAVGRGPFSLGLHCDQGAMPLPWGQALNVNATWCLTDYTKEGGAIALVPGSHHRKCHPVKEAAEEAIAVEAKRGSLILFGGLMWHGAYPRKTEGLRITIVNYFRHMAVLPQQDIPNLLSQDLADDCDDPALFRKLCGFGAMYGSGQNDIKSFPTVKGEEVDAATLHARSLAAATPRPLEAQSRL